MEVAPEDGWLLVKRGFYWRPNAVGYTGFKSEAGIYSDEQASAHADHGDGTTKVRFRDADEFSPMCPDDAKVRVLTARLEALQRERDEADNALVDRYRDPKTGAFSFPADVAAIVRRLDRAERDRDEAREALKPFADWLTNVVPARWFDDVSDEHIPKPNVPLGAYRRARSALSPKEAEE